MPRILKRNTLTSPVERCGDPQARLSYVERRSPGPRTRAVPHPAPGCTSQGARQHAANPPVPHGLVLPPGQTPTGRSKDSQLNR
jgi:hypothetical protein